MASAEGLARLPAHVTRWRTAFPGLFAAHIHVQDDGTPAGACRTAADFVVATLTVRGTNTGALVSGCLPSARCVDERPATAAHQPHLASRARCRRT